MTDLDHGWSPRATQELPVQRTPAPAVQTPGPTGTAPGTGVVDLALERRDEATGALVRRVVVTDLADDSPTRRLRQAQIAARDQLLRANPEWPGPLVESGGVVPVNEVAAWLYDDSPALQEWRGQLVPSARALFPLQRPHASHLPTGTPIDDKARGFFTDSLDAVGIRTRGAVLRDVIARTSARWTAQGRTERSTWVSLACGGALPVLDSLSALHPHELSLVLVDIDPVALDFAHRLALAEGVPERDVVMLERDLVRTVVVRDDLVVELGAGTAAVVDALGIFEYFSDAACVRLLRNAHRLVADGGVLVVANMLSDRPELDWNKRGIGWPLLRERSTEQLLALVDEAGIDTSRTTVTIPQDGVYAVVSVDC